MCVSKIYQLVEYTPSRCFREFVREVTEARRLGVRDPSKSVIVDTQKLIGNCGYGGLIMDQTKYKEIRYVKGTEQATEEINDPLFINMTELDENIFDIEKAKQRITLNLPVQLGYFILQYAKLRMLQFYYDFLDKFVDRSDFEYSEMDTDSAYMALSGDSLQEIVKSHLLREFNHGLYNFCADVDIEADDSTHWLPRQCCDKHNMYDTKTPGLFKTEFFGNEKISLCSKTYACTKTTP